MVDVFVNFLQTAIKFVFFLLVAGAGIAGGKKYRDYKDAKAADTKETK